jgi:NhaC family Na+:H+ antiporter
LFIIIKKVPLLPGLFGGIGVTILVAYMTQWGNYNGFIDMTAAIMHYMQFGFYIETGNEMVNTIITRGGLQGMMWTVSLVLIAMCFGGVMEASGNLRTIADSLLKFAENTGSMVTVAILSCFFMNLLCTDQYLSILIPGRMYRKEFIKRGINPKTLARCLEDGGTLTSPLIPWNACGAAMTAFLGFQTFAFMNLLGPFIGIFLGFSGIGVAKLTDEEQEAMLALEGGAE